MEVGRKRISLLLYRYLYYFIFMSVIIYYFALKFKKRRRKYIQRQSIHNIVQILKSLMPHLSKYRVRLLYLITLLELAPKNLHLCGW